MAFPVWGLPDIKTSDTPTYTGTPSPDPTQAGMTSTAGWASVPPPSNFPTEILEGVPAPVRVTLPSASNPTVTQIGPQQYAATIPHGVSTLQLTPGMANAQQAPVSAVLPNSFATAFTYRSRNRNVATVNASGLVTAVGLGEVEILIGAARQANQPLSTPAVEVYASLNIKVLA
jgi:hypothetical protein